MTDPEEIKEEIEHQRALIKDHTKRLRVLERQAASFGLYVPPHIQTEIDDLREKIEGCEKKIERCELKLRSSNYNSTLSAASTTSTQSSNPPQSNIAQTIIDIVAKEGFKAPPIDWKKRLLLDRDSDAMYSFIGSKEGQSISIGIVDGDAVIYDKIKLHYAMKQIEHKKNEQKVLLNPFMVFPIQIDCYIYTHKTPSMSKFNDVLKISKQVLTTNNLIWIINKPDNKLYASHISRYINTKPFLDALAVADHVREIIAKAVNIQHTEQLTHSFQWFEGK